MSEDDVSQDRDFAIPPIAELPDHRLAPICTDKPAHASDGDSSIVAANAKRCLEHQRAPASERRLGIESMCGKPAHASEPTTEQRSVAVKLSGEIVKQLCEALGIEWKSRNDLLAITDQLLANHIATLQPAHASEDDVSQDRDFTIPPIAAPANEQEIAVPESDP